MKKIFILLLGVLLSVYGIAQSSRMRSPRSGSLPPASMQRLPADSFSWTGNQAVAGVCPGGTLSIHATHYDAGSTFQWLRNGAPVAGATNDSLVVSVPADYSVEVTSNSVTSTWPLLTVVGFTAPTPSFSFAPDGQCSSTPIQFTNNTPGTNTYTWNFNDPNAGPDSVSTVVNPLHSFLGGPLGSAQTFNVSLTATSTEGCPATTTQAVHTVSPSTNLGGSGLTSFNGQPVFTSCTSTGATLTFVNNSTTQPTNGDYIIIWGDNTANFTPNATFTSVNHFYAPGTYTLGFAVLGPGGCRDTGYYGVYIGSNPAVGLSNPGNTVTCSESSLTFPITSTGSNSPGTSYTVAFNDGSAPQVFNHPAPANVTHNFLISSCNTTSTSGSTSYPNSFSATIRATNPCGSSSASIVPIYVSKKPVPILNVGPSDVVCTNVPVTVSNASGNMQSVSNGVCSPGKVVWKISPATGYTVTGVLGNDLNSLDPGVWTSGNTTLNIVFNTPGTYRVRMLVGNTSLCPIDSIDQVICVNGQPTADFTLSASAGCAPFNVTSLNASVPAFCNPNRYDWTVSYSNTTGCTPSASNWSFANSSNTNSTNPEFTFSNPGVYTVQLVTTPPGNTCFATSTQTVTVKTKPNVDWQPLAPICQGQFSPVATVNDCFASTPSTYLWTFNGGTPATSVSATPVADYPNTGTFNVTLDVSNECGTTSLTQPLIVNPTPTVNAPANQVVCNTSTAPATSFTSPLPGISFTWTNDNPAIGLPASGTGDVPAFVAVNTTNAPIVATITVIPSSSTCSGPARTYTITVNPTPPINAGADQIICNASSITMQAVLAPGTTGVWDQIPSSNTTIVTPASPTTTITGLVPNATYQFRWTVTGTGICATVSDTVTILNRPLPSPASAGNDTLICDFVGGIFSSFNLQGNNPTHPWELGTWTVVAGSNTLNAAPTIVDPNQGGSLINTVGLGAGPLQGSITLQWSISNDGGCPATSDQMTITIVRRPSAGTLGPINPICFNGSTSISATGYEGNILKWRRQDAPLASNPFVDVAGNTTPNINLANLTGDVALQFIVAPVNALCLKNDTASIVLPVDGPINNSISGRIDSVCSGVSYNTGNFPASGGNGGVPTYQWQSSDDGITFTNLGTFTLSDFTFNPDHTVWLRRLVTIGTCPSISDTIKVWVEPPVTNNTITASQTICANTPPAPLAGSLPTAFGGTVTLTYQWESSSNGVNFIAIPGANGQNYAPGVLNQNTWYRRIVRSNRCPTPTGGISDTVLISVTPAPVASFVPSAVQGCSPMTVTFTNNTVGTGNTYTWDFGDGSTPLVTTSGAPLQHTFTTGVLRNFTVSLSATNICGSSTQNIVLTVQPNSVDLNLTVNGNQLSGCAPHTVKFYSSSPGGTQFTWDFQDGPVVNTINPIDSQTHVYNSPGVYNMTLRGRNNCSDTTGRITITVYAKPTAAFTPATLQACVGAPITFNNGSTGATSYEWNFGDSPATTATAAPQHSYSTPGTYTVTLVAFNTNAGGLVTCTDTIRTNVQIVASQTGSMTVSGTTSTCAPFAVTFTNNTTPASSVLWDFNDGSPTSSLNTVNHTFLLAGTYNVTLTVNTAAGCQYVTTQSITVSGPSGTLTYTGGYKCDGQGTHFEVVGSGATTYTWDMGDGSTPVTNNSSSFDYVYPNPGTYTPKVTMNSGACAYLITGSSPIRADRLRVGFTSQIVQSCGSTDVTFTDTSSVFFGVAGTKWTFSNGNIVNNAATTTQTFSNSNTLHATLQVTGTSGCILTKDIDMPVTVWSNPVVTLVPPAGNQGCARQPVTFDAVINSADPIANVQWLTSNGINGTGRPFLPVFGTPGTYTADLSVSTVNGCAVNITSPVITINPSPTVSIVDPAPICRGGSANLQANASGAANLQWSPTAGLSCTTCPNPVATPLFTTPYIVTATNAFGCSASDTAIVDVTQPITMTVLPASDSICIGDSIQLLASGATSYSWVTQATAVLSCSTCPNPVFRPLVPGIYSATVTGANSCFTQTIPITIGVGGIPEINLGPDLVLATGTVKPLVSTVTNGPIVSWLWSPATDLSCSTCPQPSVTVRQNRTYVVEGTNGFGCTNTDTLTIRTVCESLQTYIPNAFSPDGDGINDVLMVRGTGIAQVKSFRVFNRWGETVYERANFAPNDPAFGWDGKVKGKVSSPDVFIYTAEVLCENGITFTYKGNVSLLK